MTISNVIEPQKAVEPPPLPPLHWDYESLQCPRFGRLLTKKQNVFCCGLYELGALNVGQAKRVFEHIKKFPDQVYNRAYMLEIILPLYRKDMEDCGTCERYAEIVPYVLDAGFTKYGDEWYNPNTGHMLQAFRRIPND